jgi:hypothetical protein
MTHHRLVVAVSLAIGFVGIAPLAAQTPLFPPTVEGRLADAEKQVAQALALAKAQPQKPGQPAAEAEAAQWRDRVAWAKRMFQKGFMTKAQVEADEAHLQAAELAARNAAAPAPEKTATVAVKWEYKVLSRAAIEELANNDFEAGLNKLGDEGWDLYVVPTTPTAAGRGKAPEYYFKRVKGPAAKEPPKTDAPKEEARDDAHEVIKLKYVSAVDVAKTADALFGGKGAAAPRVVAEPISNSVLVNGTAQQTATVRALVTLLDVPEAADRAKADSAKPGAKDDEWVSIRLKHVNAVDFVKTADVLFGGKAADAPRLVADAATNSALIRGTPKQVDAIRGLVIVLDVQEAKAEPMDKAEMPFIVILKSAKSSDVVKVVQELYGKDAKGFRITNDPRTNVVLLYGSPVHLEEIKAVIARLDVAVEKSGDK